VKQKQTGAKRMLLPSVQGQEGGTWIVIDSGKKFPRLEKATRLPHVVEFKTIFVYTIRGMLSTFSQCKEKDHGATSLRE
nr:hypothetical protein [Tanacetum cinerariifolium]